MIKDEKKNNLIRMKQQEDIPVKVQGQEDKEVAAYHI